MQAPVLTAVCLTLVVFCDVQEASTASDPPPDCRPACLLIRRHACGCECSPAHLHQGFTTHLTPFSCTVQQHSGHACRPGASAAKAVDAGSNRRPPDPTAQPRRFGACDTAQLPAASAPGSRESAIEYSLQGAYLSACQHFQNQSCTITPLVHCYSAIFDGTKNTILGLQVLRQDNVCILVAGTQTSCAAGMLQPAAPVPLV